MAQELPFIVQVLPRPGFSSVQEWQTVERFADEDQAKAYLLSCRRASRGMRDHRLVTAQELQVEEGAQ